MNRSFVVSQYLGLIFFTLLCAVVLVENPFYAAALGGVFLLIAYVTWAGIGLQKSYFNLFFYFILMGYFTLGKGFAYLHIPNTPIYIGEVFLFFGFFISLSYFRPLFLSHFKAIILFCAWGILITAQCFPKYHIEALRDSAMYYYSFFSILIFTILHHQKKSIDWLWNYLLFAFKFIVIFHFIFKLIVFLGFDFNLVVPGTENVKLYWMKFGDLGALLAGAIVLLLMEQKKKARIFNYSFLFIVTVLSFMTLSMNRGGFLAFAGGCSVYLLSQPFSRNTKIIYFVFLAAIVVFLLIPSKSIDSGGGRDFTKDQVINNVASIVSSHRGGGTARWRLDLWSHMIHKTTDTRTHFIFGQGLGPNLAGIYGFRSKEKVKPTKHPHNFTVNVFGRMGIIGLFFWIMVNLSYFVRLIKAIRISNGTLRDLLLFFMAVWFAMLINSSFDVYLEGPMGAIPFWSFMGVGLWLTTIAHDRFCTENVLLQNRAV